MVIQNSKFKIRNSQRAFALLFAMFVSSIMLSIGLGISNVIYKELVLSGIGRESEFSLYTAQTGLECALYLQNVYPTLFPTYPGDNQDTGASYQCVGAAISAEGPLDFDVSLAGATTTFSIAVPNSGSGPSHMCAQVRIFKSASGYISVESRGYNVGCTAQDLQNPRRVERSLKLRTNIVQATP